MKQQKPQSYPTRSIIVYLILALGLTWLCWVPTLIAASSSGFVPPTADNLFVNGAFTANSPAQWLTVVVFSLAVYGPLVGGFVATYMAQGSAGVRDLTARIFKWRVGRRWYLYTIGLTFLMPALPVLFVLLAGLSELQLGGTSLTFFSAVFLFGFQLLTSGLGEEPGWRGFFLPAIQSRISGIRAIWFIGLIWAIWHFPFTIYVTWAGSGQPGGAEAVAIILPALIGQIISLIGLTYIYTWLYNNTGSVWLMILFHALSNTFIILALAFVSQNPLLPLIIAAIPWLVVFVLQRAVGKGSFPGQPAAEMAN